MKRFIKLLFASGLGVAVAAALYRLAIYLIVYHRAPFLSDVVETGVIASVLFGGVYAIAHCLRRPTVASSLAISAACIACIVAIAYHYGTFLGFTTDSVIALVSAALAIAAGAFAGSKLAVR